MIKVITYGTFDLFHIGHLELLKRAKQLGDYLVVAVSTDQFNAIKGKQCVYPFQHRKAIVEAIRFVDEVIAEDNWDQKIDDVKRHKISKFVIGEDWKGKFDFLSDYCEVIYLPRTPSISSSEIKIEICQNHNLKNA